MIHTNTTLPVKPPQSPAPVPHPQNLRHDPLAASDKQNCLNPRESIEWLRRYSSCGLTPSLEFLRLASESGAILTLYEKMFPREWTASTKGLFTPSKESPLYTERETEFFTLLDRHVVPLNTDWIYDTEEGRTPFVPVFPLQEYDWCYDEWHFEQLPRAYQLALALNRTDNELFDALCEMLDYEPEVLPAGKVNWERLSRVMCAGDTPLKYLPKTIDITVYATGNPLLDWHPEAGEPDVEWTLDELRWLGSLRRQAELLQRRIARLSKWLDERDTHDRITFCIRLWNLAGTEHDHLLTTKEAVSAACEYEVKRFRVRVNPHANQLTLFDTNP